MAGFSMLVAIALGHATPAKATEAPDISICDDIPYRSNGEDIASERASPIALPADWAAVATSSRNWIAIWTEFSRTYCVETTGMREVTHFERFGDRFLGFKWASLEGSGYVLIDRARQGHMIDTGSKPHFSPDGSKFASLHRADTGLDGFDGFAIWQTYGNALEPLIVNAGPPLYPRYDWRIDRWEGEDCLHISSVSSEWNGGDKAAIPALPRYRFVATASTDWEIIEGIKCHNRSNDDNIVTLPSADEPPITFDWANGVAAFAAAAQNSPLVYTIAEAARCYGRWKLHAKAVDNGGFPEVAFEVFIDTLRYPAAVNSAHTFLPPDRNHPAARDAEDEAERLLRLAWIGDEAAARSYFVNLGSCHAEPESAHDVPAATKNAAATRD
jgi:hypothetical protein